MKPLNNFILMGVLAGLTAVLDYIGVITFPFGFFGVSAFYIGAAFFMAFAIWFKWKALPAMYIGLLISALISGTFTIFAFILALGDVIGAALVMLFFRSKKLKLNPELKTFKDYAFFILSSTIIQNIVSAIWVLGGFVLFGIMPISSLKLAIFGWVLGGMAVSIIIGIPLLKIATPVVKKTSFYK
jgi:integral membrane sensor domain MASE1